MSQMVMAQLHSLGYIGVFFVIMMCGRLCMNVRVQGTYSATDLILGGNAAISMRRSGFYAAIGIAMMGVLIGDTGATTYVGDLTALVGYGVLTLFFLLVALWVNDKLILPTVNNNSAVVEDNRAVGVVEFGALVGTGIIAASSLSTGPDNMFNLTTIMSALVFFACGQAAMIFAVRLYEFLTPFTILEEIKKGNMAAGVLLSGKIIAYAIILRAAVSGDFVGWGVDLTAFAVSAVSGLIFLYVAEILVDKLLLPGKRVRHFVEQENIAATMLIAAAKIGMAFVISTVVI